MESNLHYFQWVTFCQIAAGTSWVHASVVDRDGYLVSVGETTIRSPFSDYLKCHSTRLAVIRPPYTSQHQVQAVLSSVQATLGTPYDPSFTNPTANCTGLVGESLKRAGISVKQIESFGHKGYSPSSFFEIPGARVVWSSQ